MNDLDVAYCSLCNQAFGPLKRRVSSSRFMYARNSFLSLCSCAYASIIVETGKIRPIFAYHKPSLTIQHDSGNIFCHDCSTRKVPLPQLGYGTKPVRVCNGCFDVAYLVTYAIDEDHGLSTQVRTEMEEAILSFFFNSYLV